MGEDGSENDDLACFQQRIGYLFKEERKLKRALYHASLKGEGIEHSSERLKFLGSVVLGFCVADEIFHRWSNDSEDDLTRRLHALTCTENLSEIGHEFGIEEVLTVEGSLKGQEFPESIIEDAVEALIGAIYDDGGMQRVRPFIDSIFFDPQRQDRALSRRDWITEMKELYGRYGIPYAPRIETRIIDGKKAFFVFLEFQGKGAIGKGKSKKEAESVAARCMLRSMPRKGNSKNEG